MFKSRTSIFFIYISHSLIKNLIRPMYAAGNFKLEVKIRELVSSNPTQERECR